jgi:hypothetical protein
VHPLEESEAAGAAVHALHAARQSLLPKAYGALDTDTFVPHEDVADPENQRRDLVAT